jgi:hypothetical protein
VWSIRSPAALARALGAAGGESPTDPPVELQSDVAAPPVDRVVAKLDGVEVCERDVDPARASRAAGPEIGGRMAAARGGVWSATHPPRSQRFDGRAEGTNAARRRAWS